MGGKPGMQLTPKQGRDVLSLLFYSFLNADAFIEAALLAWGNIQFNPEPMEVQRIWDAMINHQKVLILGAAALGKSYSGMALKLLNWCQDPQFTNEKIISTTLGHAKGNTWGTLLEFHRSSIVPLPGKPGNNILSFQGSKQAAMAVLAIPEGDDGKGRLQGFHPTPRVVAHPKFGKLSRVGAFIDEAEKVPEGLWVGVDNLLASQTKEGSVRIVGATNPEDIGSSFAQRAEPPNGWDSIDEDTDFEWMSAMGWKVLRLDAKYTANVVQKKEVNPGMQTWDGYCEYLRKGINHPRYWTFGRGMYPKVNIEYGIIPIGHLTQGKEIYNFVSATYNIASLDPAFAPGGDDPYLTAARYGLADGFLGGKKFPEPIMGIQIEQQFPLKKDNTALMADSLMEMLRMLRVRPEWFIMDKSGNALGLYDLLRLKWGDIMGVQWNEGSTDKKILQEDSERASERYKGIDTEMWFAFARWLEYNRVLFSPILDTQRLFDQLITRKFRTSGRLYRLESKEEYKLRTHKNSPDQADSTVMLIHLCRSRQGERPSLMPPAPPRKSDSEWIFPKVHKSNAALPFIRFND